MNSESRNLSYSADERIRSSVLEHSLRPAADIDRRLAQLQAEKDVECAFEMIAAVVGMAGLFLGIFGRRRYLLLPALVLPYLYRAAREGEAPPLNALRHLGMRSREEILREFYALKALRGDFQLGDHDDPASRAEQALKAVQFG